MFYKDIHKYLQVIQHKFHASKDYKQSLWEGEGTKEKNKTKTNQKSELVLPLQINFNKWKVVSGNIPACNSFNISTVTIFENYRPHVTETYRHGEMVVKERHKDYRKYC